MVLFGLCLCQCASNITVTYPGAVDWEGRGRGSLVVNLNHAMSNLSISIDGCIVLENAHTKRVQIDNLAAGRRTLQIVARGTISRRALTKTVHVLVVPNEISTVSIQWPATLFD